MSNLKNDYNEVMNTVAADLKTVTQNILLEMKVKLLLEAVEASIDHLRGLDHDLSNQQLTSEQKEGTACREIGRVLLMLEQVLLKAGESK
jgi:hypothetical protein